MSTIKVTNIQATGETASRAVSGVAAAWSNHDLSGTTSRASFNVSSYTDNATGDHSITVTSAFSSADYCWSYGGKRASGDGTNCFDVCVFREAAPTSTITRHSVKDHDSTSDVDAEHLCVTFHGDLA